MSIILTKGLYAFHVEYSVGYQLISETFYEDEKCGLQGITFFQMTDPWYAIQKNSSYTELLKTGYICLTFSLFLNIFKKICIIYIY